MATFDLPAIPEARPGAQLLVGAASPLWAYYGAATAGGMAYWLLTRWAQPVNLEALFDTAGGVARVETVAALLEMSSESVEAENEAEVQAARAPEKVSADTEAGDLAATPEPGLPALIEPAPVLAEAGLGEALESEAPVDAPPIQTMAPEPAPAPPANPTVADEPGVELGASVEGEATPKARGRKAGPSALHEA